MDKMYFWTCVIGIGVGTWLIRSSFLFLSAKITLSHNVKQSLCLIPVAVLPALIAPAIFLHQGDVAWLAGHERILALALASVVCIRTKNMPFTLLVGLIGLYLIRL